MKAFLYIILLFISTNLPAQDNSYEDSKYYEFTMINNLKILDDYATFVTDNGTIVKVVDDVWINYFSQPSSELDKEEVHFIFYSKRNEFLSFGVVYDTSIIEVSPRKKIMWKC